MVELYQKIKRRKRARRAFGALSFVKCSGYNDYYRVTRNGMILYLKRYQG